MKSVTSATQLVQVSDFIRVYPRSQQRDFGKGFAPNKVLRPKKGHLPEADFDFVNLKEKFIDLKHSAKTGQQLVWTTLLVTVERGTKADWTVWVIVTLVHLVRDIARSPVLWTTAAVTHEGNVWRSAHDDPCSALDEDTGRQPDGSAGKFTFGRQHEQARLRWHLK